MSVVRLKWHDREVVDALKRMRRHRGTFAPVMKELRVFLREDLRHHAQRQEGPEGKWPRRSPQTLERYRHRVSVRKTKGMKKRIRRDRRRLLGRLPTAVTIRARKMSVLAVSKVPWSEVHNVGGRVGRRARLPAREFVFISPAMLTIAADKMAEFVVKEWGR